MEFKIPFLKSKEQKSADYKTYLVANNQYHFLDYNNSKLAIEGYIKNVIVYKCINVITSQFRKCNYLLYQYNSSGDKREIENNELLNLLSRPYPGISQASHLERLATQYLIYGENYIQKKFADRIDPGIPQPNKKPQYLYALRPDFINNIPGKNHFNSQYQYNPEYDSGINFQVTLTGQSNLMIMRKYNPQNDFHGLSPIVPAGYSIDTHNAYSKMTNNLAQNGAMPTGILTVPADRRLEDSEFERIKKELMSQTGPEHAGKPKILEGGMTWTQISIEPEKMQANDTLKQQAYNIALAFGVPMELLNQEQGKFTNKQEAYEQLYEDAVLPLTKDYFDLLNAELVPLYGTNLRLEPDYTDTMVMRQREDNTMQKINKINYLTPNEKRAIVGYEDHPEGEGLDQGSTDSVESEEKSRFISQEVKDGLSYEEASEIANEIYG